MITFIADDPGRGRNRNRANMKQRPDLGAKAVKPGTVAEDVTAWEVSGEENLCRGVEQLLLWSRC